MAEQSNTRSRSLAKPLQPGTDISSTVIHNFVGRTLTDSSLMGLRRADSIVPSCIDTQDAATVRAQAFA
jgi:hypothetical protein